MVYTIKLFSCGGKCVRHLFATCWVTAVLVLATPATAQSEKVSKIAELVTVELKSQFGTAEQLNAVITKTYGVKLSPEKENVARNSLRAVMFNEAVPMYIAKLISPFYHPDTTQKELASAMAEGIAQLQVKGVLRLSSERQASFVAHMVSMAKAIPSSDCKAMFIGRLDTTASVALERRYIASLPSVRFESITNLYREAIEAELAGYPDARTINLNQAKLAEKVYETATVKRLHAKVAQAVLQRVNQGAENAPSSEVCLVMSETIEAMLDMAEPYRSWQLTRFMESIQ
jgi:hypothetical protein